MDKGDQEKAGEFTPTADPEETDDYEELEEYGEESYDDAEDDGEIVIHFKPWMIPAFAGMMILAILICIPLWRLSHRGQNRGNAEPVVMTETAQTEGTEDIVTEPVITQTPQPVPTETPAVVVTEEPSVEPSATPRVQSTSEPAATSGPLSEGNIMTFGEVNETVTAKDVTNLRNSPTTGGTENVVGQLKNGETLTRTGRNDSTGWSRLYYNGQTVYAVSAYLTTDVTYKTPEKPSNPNRISTQDGRVIIFTDCDDYITPKELINLRTEPSTSEGESTVRTQVKNGTNLHRTGYSEDSGWSRVEYNGEILYAVTNYVISGSAPE